MNLPLIYCTLMVTFLMQISTVIASDSTPIKQTSWHGHVQNHHLISERPAWVVLPKKALPGNPWIWRARFPSFHNEMDRELVKQGFHLAYVDVAGLFGSPQAIAIGESFYDFVVDQYQLSSKPVLEGVSRGGLFVYRWALKFPEKVSCIYCDTPVLDFKSWPAGRGNGMGHAASWEKCLEAYQLTEEEAIRFQYNPVDQAERISQLGIPMMHIVSENDVVVPPRENTYLLKTRLEQFGHPLEIISVPVGTAKSHGHHFDHPEPDRVVQFIRQFGQSK